MVDDFPDAAAMTQAGLSKVKRRVLPTWNGPVQIFGNGL